MERQAKNFLIKSSYKVLILALLAGCGTTDPEYKERSVSEIYNEAYKLLAEEDYTLAAKEFAEVDRQHPYSPWATRAQLMAAFAYFEAQKYNDAIDNLEIFIQLHPGHEEISYAYYLLAMCYYEQIPTVDRDQKNTRLAKHSLEELIKRFPESKYSRDAKLKLELVSDHLAGHEMQVGRYYQYVWNHLAAMNRFKDVVINYQTTDHVPEALYRLIESSLSLGMLEEAQKAAAILGYNYPDQFWYKDGYALLQEYAKNRNYSGFDFVDVPTKSTEEIIVTTE